MSVTQSGVSGEHAKVPSDVMERGTLMPTWYCERGTVVTV